MKKIVIGILAHVDSGKTSLAEAMLFQSNYIKEIGRVDHKNSFLDHDTIEQQRGITIYAKDARMKWNDVDLILLDTPGHVDFSAEMERAIQVLDVAILVISGTAGVQSHTLTLWNLLKKYRIPVFIFVNKMDLYQGDKSSILSAMQKDFHEPCIIESCPNNRDWNEAIAYASENLMEAVASGKPIQTSWIQSALKERQLFLCYFGSALKVQGIRELLDGVTLYTTLDQENLKQGARVYKITHDEQDNRLTHLKVVGGFLRLKEEINGEKINQIRIYSGKKYELVKEVGPGDICVIPGLKNTYVGQGLGSCKTNVVPVIEPVMTYQIVPDEEIDLVLFYQNLKQFEEEDPTLKIQWEEQLQEIHIYLMGEIQQEILAQNIKERLGIGVHFEKGSIRYKETLLTPTLGVGHFEPLRHYAEVVLYMEPLERGSGLQISSICKEEELDLNWQRLICSQLAEIEHKGTIIGAPVTDIKITLVGGKAHKKHTQGGDFRQAAMRAVRQGLRMGETTLLEPYYHFKMKIPAEDVGRCMTDLTRMMAEFNAPDREGDRVLLEGEVSVHEMIGYQQILSSFTKGQGQLQLIMAGYEQCKRMEDILEKAQADDQMEGTNPSGSIFCKHGAGTYLPWEQVYEHMHVENDWINQYFRSLKNMGQDEMETGAKKNQEERVTESGNLYDKEFDMIYKREFSGLFEKRNQLNRSISRVQFEKKEKNPLALSLEQQAVLSKLPQKHKQENKEEFLLVDGYNIIHGWPDLKELAQVNLNSARDLLMDILCNYQGYTGKTVILVFDAYKIKGNAGSILEYRNIHVVYTKDAETADMYIEKVTHQLGRKHKVVVATSDALEQMIVLGNGATRLSATGLLGEIRRMEQEIREEFLSEERK